MEGLLIGRPPRPDDTGAGRGCEAPAIPPRQRFAGTGMGNKAVVSRFPLGSAYKRRRICYRGVRLIVFRRAQGRTSWPRDRCAATRKRRNRRPTRTSRKAELRPRRSRPARRRRVKARTARRPERLPGNGLPRKPVSTPGSSSRPCFSGSCSRVSQFAERGTERLGVGHDGVAGKAQRLTGALRDGIS